MSMLSAQVDELRAMAESVGLAMPQAATLMMEAADTITELREENERFIIKLNAEHIVRQNIEVENTKLRDYLEHKRHLQDFVRLVSENARLREACAELLKMAERHDPEWLHWPEIHDELRKLGVEVDE